MIRIFTLLFVLNVFWRCFSNDEPRKLIIDRNGEYDALPLFFVIGVLTVFPIPELHFFHYFNHGHHLLLLSIWTFN